MFTTAFSSDPHLVPISEPPEWGKGGEGQLSVDVLHTEKEVIIVATMAGTKPDHISLHLHNDLLTIRGERQAPIPLGGEYFYQECYWGPFSRTIVLPTEVKEESAHAEYRNGVLIIRLAKAKSDNQIPLLVIEE